MAHSYRWLSLGPEAKHVDQGGLCCRDQWLGTRLVLIPADLLDTQASFSIVGVYVGRVGGL